MAAFYPQQPPPMYVNSCSPVHTMALAPHVGYPLMSISQPKVPTTMMQPAMQIMMPPPTPSPPVGTSMSMTQQDMDETLKPEAVKKCPYCGLNWNPITISKITTGNVVIGTIFGLCGVIPGVLYCFCTRQRIDACFRCRKVANDDDYCCEF